MSDALIPAMHGRDHLPGGRDPIPLNSLTNDWCQASGGFSCASTPSITSPSLQSVGFTSLDRTSDSAGIIYIPTSTTIPTIVLGKPGGYRIKLIAGFPEGKAGYCNVAGVIGGDAWLGNAWAPRFTPLSYDRASSSSTGTGGGVATWEQDIEVLSTATVGSAHQVGIYATVWQSSGATLVGIVTLKIVRLT